MPTTRRFVANGLTASAVNWSAQDGGDTPQFIFTEGAWVFQWDGYYNVIPPGTIGAAIQINISGFYEVPLPESSGDPPVIILQSTIQSLIDGGATITAIGASIGGSAPGDPRITYTPPTQPTTLAELAAIGWNLTVNAGPGTPELNITVASGNLTLEVPDAPTLTLIGSGGVIISGGVGVDGGPYFTTSGFPVGPMIILIGSGGIIVNSSATMVLSADISGIYTLVKDKTDDTLYRRSGFSIFVETEDVKIPDPFIKTAFIGG